MIYTYANIYFLLVNFIEEDDSWQLKLRSMALAASAVWRSVRCSEADGYEVVAINDLTSPKMLAHLLKYDTAQGSFWAESARTSTPSSPTEAPSWSTARRSPSTP